MDKHGGQRNRWLCLIPIAWLTLLSVVVLALWEKQDLSDRQLGEAVGMFRESADAMIATTDMMRMFVILGGCGPIPDGTTRVFEVP